MKIETKHIEWYFNSMKSKGMISEGWQYSGFSERKEVVVIRYMLQYKKKDKIFNKISSYSFPKELVIQELRHAKLQQLIN